MNAFIASIRIVLGTHIGYGLVVIVRLQRLLPLKRALTNVEHDVRDTHDALEEVSL